MPLRERTALMSIARSFLCGGHAPRAARLLACTSLLALACAGLLPTAEAATGQTLTVTTSADGGAGSLRAAITQANADTNDTITFANTVTSPITLTTGELLITGGVTITGPGVASLTISGNNASRVFHVSGGRVTITGLTITAGKVSDTNGGGGILVDSRSSLAVNNCTLTTNSALNSSNNSNPGGVGGAILNNGTLSVSASTFSANMAAALAGAIAGNGTLTVSGTTFSANTASLRRVGGS